MQRRLVERLSQMPRMCGALCISNTVMTSLIFLSFPALLLLFIIDGFYIRAVLAALICGVPFVIVSLVRKLLNRERPYELFGISPILKREHGGSSFPSRHAFSACIISVIWMTVSIPVGIALSVVSLGICIIRYLCGVHFISDLLAGALVGIFSGIVGIALII